MSILSYIGLPVLNSSKTLDGSIPAFLHLFSKLTNLIGVVASVLWLTNNVSNEEFLFNN